MASKDLVYAWLKDAHGMEKALVDFGERAKKNFDGRAEYDDLIATLTQKGNEHQEAVRVLLKEEDASVSSGKDFLAKLSSFVGGVGSSLFGDDEVKDLLVLNGAFHFANACYVSLAHGARIVGDEALADACDRIATEKLDLADQVLATVPDITAVALAEKADK